MINTINPATGVLEKTFARLVYAEIEVYVQNTFDAYRCYRQTSLMQRAEWLNNLSDLLLQDKKNYATLITTEMGKPITQALAEIEKCAEVCRYYADCGVDLLQPQRRKNATIYHDPIGIILAIMPWNFPFWQVIRCLAPTLMVGNGMLLKHASNVPQCALAIADLVGRAGFVPNIMQTLLIDKSDTDKIIRDPRVMAVTITGSENAGITIATQSATVLKPVILELGGSDPFVIMPDCDIKNACITAVQSRMLNTGQSCISAKRFLIHDDIYDIAVEHIMTELGNWIPNDPMLPNTKIGPLATQSILDSLDNDVNDTIKMGARCLLSGGKIHDKAGFFYRPMVLSDIPAGSPAFTNELFGPVVSLYRVNDLNHAINLANSSKYGLGATIWTNNKNEQSYFVENIAAGTVVVNGMVRSDPALPFGGVKASGYGRELGEEGLFSFTNIKTVRGI